MARKATLFDDLDCSIIVSRLTILVWFGSCCFDFSDCSYLGCCHVVRMSHAVGSERRADGTPNIDIMNPAYVWTELEKAVEVHGIRLDCRNLPSFG